MYKYKRLLLVLSALCSLIPALLYSQVDTAWTRRYNGPANTYDIAYAIAVDSSRNVYVTGYSEGTGTSADYTTIKYNTNGDTQWVRRYNGPGNNWDRAFAIAVDRQGNVYVTGESYNSSTNNDYATVKYNSAGVEQWVKRYTGAGSDYDAAYAIAVDSSGNVYVTGYIHNPASSYDYATIKYNSNGDTLWVRKYNGPDNNDDQAASLAVDGQGNVYVTGYSSGATTSADYATIKYNSAGDTVWVRRYNGTGNYTDGANAIAVDGSGNVYVTGYSNGSSTDDDYATVKYNSVGVEQWVARYNGPGNYVDEAKSIAVDNTGNVYVTGSSNGSGSNTDYATIKYNSTGAQQWVQRYNGQGNYYDNAKAIGVDGSGNVYVTGYSNGSSTNEDYATIKYNSAGVQQWVQRYNGPENYIDEANAIALDGSGNVYVTGNSRTGGFDDYLTIRYVQTIPGVEEVRGQMQEARAFKIYPNPARLFFVVRYPSSVKAPANIKIYDVTGKIVKEVRGKRQAVRISTDGIKDGVYFVKVGDETVIKKLVITK